jgi:hypothetical protein
MNEVIQLKALPPLAKEKRKGRQKGDPTAKDGMEVWVAWVGEAWRKSVEHIILTGQRLAKFRSQFAHGKWEEAIEKNLHLSSSSVHKLIAIGEHKVLSNPSCMKDLPPSWGALYELSRIDDKVLEQKLGKEVHPGLEVKEAVKLRKGWTETPKKKSDNPWHKLEKAIDAFIKTTTTQAKEKGVTDLELADIEVNKEEFFKRLDGLIVNLKEFKKKRG